MRSLPQNLEKLETLGIHVNYAVLASYAEVRDDDLTIGYPTNEKIARSNFCYTVAPCIAINLSRQLSNKYNTLKRLYLGHAGLKAFVEFHDPVSSKLELDHAYAMIGGKDPNNDIIIDGTYQQFLRPEVQELFPLAFVGTRREVQTLMQEFAVYPEAVEYYQQDTLAQTKTEWINSNVGITYPRS